MVITNRKLETKLSLYSGCRRLNACAAAILSKVADTHYAGTNVGGRVLAVNGKSYPRSRNLSQWQYYFTYINAQAKHQDIKIVSVNGAEVTLDPRASRARGLRCM